MTITNALAGLAVENITVAMAFYERLFGRQPDARPMSEVAEWKFSTGGWVQVFTDADRAGSSLVTLIVSDINELVDDLAGKDIKPVAKRSGDFAKTAIYRDPDGNQLVFSQTLRNTY
ncbi:glyoxalase [Devosia pacifica]|uniref:Glyoxalase n=1 Tax=Devosia pacifica TaxID=1335967 RepID=A0A918S3R0_9HYPH|nr:VOC family protein [Devosia pacifica]GHA23162.1 glyoxalase [Devosia pacifica]